MRWETFTQADKLDSPIKKYIEWKKIKDEDAYFFISRDGEKEVKEKVESFMIIDEVFQPRGYLKSKGVYLRGKFMKSKKDKIVIYNGEDEVYNGVYDMDTTPSWIKIYRCLTVVIDGELVRLDMPPAAGNSFRDIWKNDDGWRPFDDRYKYYVECTGKEKGTAAGNEFEYPTFKIGKEITKADAKVADEWANTYKEYTSQFTTKSDVEYNPDIEVTDWPV